MAGGIKQLRAKHPKIFIGGALVLVAVLALAAGLAFSTLNKDNSQAAQDKFNEVNTRSNQAFDQQEYEKAVGIWQDYLKEKPEKEFSYQAHIQLAAAYMNTGQFNEARDNFRLAEKEKDSEQYEVLLGIAQSSEAMGDKQTAIEYYKKVVEVLKRNVRSFSQQDLQVYQAKLETLEGNQQ